MTSVNAKKTQQTLNVSHHSRVGNEDQYCKF